MIIYVGLIKYVAWQTFIILHKKFGKHLVIVYACLWLWDVSYDSINIVPIWHHCDDLIYSVQTVHKDYLTCAYQGAYPFMCLFSAFIRKYINA